MIITKDWSCLLDCMKKLNKVLNFFAIAIIMLTMLLSNVFATETAASRLAGTSAAQTAAVIAEQTGWAGTAILASSESYGESDALTVGPLAKFLNAPILLQEAGAMLNTDTKAELIKLNVKKVYVTSGAAVINQTVFDQLTGMGITVISLAGVDRFETSVNIAREMIALGAHVTKVAVANGWSNQDALSIAPIAAASNEPILLTEKTSVPASVQAFLTANVNVTSSDVIGGLGVISDAVKAQFPNATRHYGKTAYDTNNQVITDFSSSLDFKNVYIANIVNGIDAIAGAPLAAQTKSAIVLTDGTIHTFDAATFVRSKLTSSSIVTALGGESVVPENVRIGLKADSDVTTLSGQAEELLSKYDLHPKDVAKEQAFKLEGNVDLLNDASLKIGFDLSEYKGKEVKALVYTLKETSQYNGGLVKAYVLFDRAVIGAYLILDGYTPGVASLNDRSYFMPISLIANDLEFKGVKKVEIEGPWEQNQWVHQLTLSSSNDLDSFLNLVSKSIPVQQNKGYTSPDSVKKYIIILYFEDGPVVRGRLYLGVDFTKLTLDPFSNWSYDTSNELRTFVEQSLG
ncbi:cell wall-binding repeat-containing protein [Desulfosporosinus sp. PR]|uniref:cell wall-binding repeat-containing protein n=1 Tax=Candidatus Desulfosporosinus nitrosoreducens TaxID=3401928 RepID=UPI0027E60781|nr:cell wall-binding repeat-containing protein [Desulfosporosinus sp. PR]MDQ7095439.1 cell wall-binding repeat-containing protein [Desulfosporosinus sp. PR]